MSTAVEWLERFQERLDQMREAHESKDYVSAEEIMEQIAPHPVGDKVFVKENFSGYGCFFTTSVRVLDPEKGRLDNSDGPAVIKKDGTRIWYRHGLVSNTKGPAKLYPNGDVRWYYNGHKVSTAEELDSSVASAKAHAARTVSIHNPNPGGNKND